LSRAQPCCRGTRLKLVYTLERIPSVWPDDFLNIAIISDINRLIGDSGYHFAVCDNLGMPNWVVALTHEEEDSLRHDRGWSFLAL
jgi:hypothetical protein